MSEKNVSDKARAKILALIPEYFKEAFPTKTFIAGKDAVTASGTALDEADLMNLIDASLDCWLTTGRFTDNFERKFARWVGTNHALLVNSGSSANLLALASLTSQTLGKRALTPGDEVITVAAGFPTTVNPIYQYGLIPVYVDIDIPTYNTSLDKIKEAMSPRTKAIFMAHTLGNPFDAENLSIFAKDQNLWLIEDCCDALGSELKNRKAGTFGDLSTFSFFPAHHITMGEGGAVLTNSAELSALLHSFRNWGRDCQCNPGQDNRCGNRFSQKFGELPDGYDHKYVFSEMGYNLKVTEMQAAVGLSQLQKLDGFIKRREENFRYLMQGLEGLKNKLILPESIQHANPSWFGLPIAIKPESGIVRESLLRLLDSRKIGTRLLFAGNLTKQPAYIGRRHRIAAILHNTDYVMKNVFWVGVHPGLSKAMLDYIILNLEELLGDSPSNVL
jgi:CDP-6-deoxy-D-xylo-4-hexulose-3-dehydrase